MALAAVPMIAIGAAALLFVPALLENFEAPKAFAVRIVGLSALAGGAVALAGARLAFTFADIAVAFWLLVEIVATVTSRAPLLSLFGETGQHEGLLTSLAMAGIYLAVRRTGDRDRFRTDWLDVAIAATALASIYALLQSAGLDPLRWVGDAQGGPSREITRPFGTLGHPNLLGVATAGTAAAALSRAMDVPARRWLHAPAAVLLAATAALTLSRAAWLALAAGVGVVGLLHVLEGRRPTRRVVAGAAVGVVLLGMLLVTSRWGEVFTHRLGESLSLSTGTAATRAEIWRSALAMAREHPLSGTGPDTFAVFFGRFQTPDYWRMEFGAVPQHAHSLYLHVLATRGVLGGLALVGLALVPVVAAWRIAVRRCRAPGARASLALLVAVALASGFGSPGVMGAVLGMCALATLAPLTSRLPRASREPAGAARRDARAVAGPDPARHFVHHRGRRVPVAATVAGALAALLVGVELLASNLAFRSIHARATDPARAVELSRRALALWPGRRILAEHVESLTFAASANVDRAHALEEAVRVLERGVPTTPRGAHGDARLGMVLGMQLTAGLTPAPDRARAAARMDSVFAHARTMSPHDALLAVEEARTLIVLDRAAGAIARLEPMAARYPGQGIVLAELAYARLGVGDGARAAELLARAVDGRWRRNEGLERRRAEETLARLGGVRGDPR